MVSPLPMESIMVQITKAQIEQATKIIVVTEQATKIIVVTYTSYLQKWYPYSLENFERIILDMGNIENIEIIEKGE
jgi:hypothetical protein